jgi:hypothetical protein
MRSAVVGRRRAASATQAAGPGAEGELAVDGAKAVELHRRVGRLGRGGRGRLVGAEQLVQVQAVEARARLDVRHRGAERGAAVAFETVAVERAGQRPVGALGIGAGVAAQRDLQRLQALLGDRRCEVRR